MSSSFPHSCRFKMDTILIITPFHTYAHIQTDKHAVLTDTFLLTNMQWDPCHSSGWVSTWDYSLSNLKGTHLLILSHFTVSTGLMTVSCKALMYGISFLWIHNRVDASKRMKEIIFLSSVLRNTWIVLLKTLPREIKVLEELSWGFGICISLFSIAYCRTFDCQFGINQIMFDVGQFFTDQWCKPMYVCSEVPLC